MSNFSNKPFVSVIIPCRNEEKFIAKVLDNILAQDYEQSLLEVFVVDGNSDDNTASIIKAYEKKHTIFKYENNAEKTVPFALNKAIRKCKGDVVIRLDAHSVYPVNYISRLVFELFNQKADNTGGVWDTVPGSNTLVAKSIAVAMAHPFGIGNAHYRLGSNQIKQVDTVPFGCYKRKVFEEIGLFDEELTRNQDDEFNGRLIKNGGKIFLVPDVVITYFARETFKKMAVMFYQYGLFKPLVNIKLGSAATMRQFVPLFFVLFLIGMPVLVFIPYLNAMAVLVLLMYKACVIYFSVQLSVKKNNMALFPFIAVAFILIHTSYGWGYLRGLINFRLKRRVSTSVKINMSR